jgi:hypothetical protein
MLIVCVWIASCNVVGKYVMFSNTMLQEIGFPAVTVLVMSTVNSRPSNAQPLALNDHAWSRAIELLLDSKCGGTRYVTYQALKLESCIHSGTHLRMVGGASSASREHKDSLVCRRGTPPKCLTDTTEQ